MNEFESANTEEVAEPQTMSPEYQEALEDPGVNWEDRSDEAEGIENNEAEQDETSETEEVAEPQKSKAQSKEENSQYAKIRREAEAKAEAKAKDQMIAEIYGESHGIYTYEAYQAAVKEAQMEQEAEEKGVDPKFYEEYKSMQEKLAAYERKNSFADQEKALSNDPIKGKLYKDWKDDIHSMSEEYGVDLQTAFTFMLNEKLGDILGQTTQDTIKKINSNGKSSPGSLSQPGIPDSSNAWDMSDKDFTKMLERAKRGDLSK